MNILFITIPFYEYTERIKKQMQINTNAEVDTLYIDYTSNGIISIFNKIKKGEYDRKVDFKNQKIFFESHAGKKYDYVFTLVGRGLNKELFKCFLKSQKEAKKILYLWDDVDRVENFYDIKDCYDRIISFDKKDCMKYKFEFLPLFYCEDYIYKSEKKIYDISTIGFLHSDREYIISKILKQFPNDKYKWFALLKTTRKHIIMQMVKTHRINKVKFYIAYKNMSIRDSASVVKKSKVVIDIPHNTQTGLSMRTFEALASNAKLITTNEEIKKYDFYNEDNICIIDRKEPKISKEFIVTDYKKNDDGIVGRYSLESWINSIFN